MLCLVFQLSKQTNEGMARIPIGPCDAVSPSLSIPRLSTSVAALRSRPRRPCNPVGPSDFAFKSIQRLSCRCSGWPNDRSNTRRRKPHTFTKTDEMGIYQVFASRGRETRSSPSASICFPVVKVIWRSRIRSKWDTKKWPQRAVLYKHDKRRGVGFCLPACFYWSLNGSFLIVVSLSESGMDGCSW